MKLTTPPPMAFVAKSEEKSDGLSAFVGEALKGTADGTTTLTLIARSASSPIARAVAANGAELARRRVVIQAIFAELGAERTADGWTLAGPSLPFTSEVRHARNRMYLDLHEQLIVGSSHVWYGDSLRRDPDKRDALSLFNRNCQATRHAATQTFLQLWAASQPLIVERSLASVPVFGAVNIGLPALGSLSARGVPDVTPPMPTALQSAALETAAPDQPALTDAALAASAVSVSTRH